MNLKTLQFLIFQSNLFTALLQIIAIHFTDRVMDSQSIRKIQKSSNVRKLRMKILDQCIFCLIKLWSWDLQIQFFSLKLIRKQENGVNTTKFQKWGDRFISFKEIQDSKWSQMKKYTFLQLIQRISFQFSKT